MLRKEVNRKSLKMINHKIAAGTLFRDTEAASKRAKGIPMAASKG
jgi:hypothetical protein